ncbi:MAG: tetratricopeptide repeat protein [Methylococcales bacterium]|nr:tetratricopeptide repeat protein [Methylococcales bacterium]
MKAPHILTPQHPLLQKAVALYQAGKPAAALPVYKQLLASFPDDAMLLNTLGSVSLQVGDYADSVAFNRQALQIDPSQPAVWFYLGIGLKQLQRFQEALDSFERAIGLSADFAEAYCNRGSVLQDLRRFEDALRSFEQAIAIRPAYPLAFNNSGISLRHLKRYAEAVAAYDRALALKPDFAEAWCHRGVALLDLNRIDEAMTSYARALAIRPGYADAWYNQGLAFYKLQNYQAALDSFERAQGLKPDFDFLPAQILYTKAQICDWRDFDVGLAHLKSAILAGRKACFPFALHAFSDNPALQRKAAEIWTQAKYPPLPGFPAIAGHAGHDRIRIGYFSADFRQHPVAFLCAELFERHDRSRFEVTAFCYAAVNRKDEMRLRLENAFERFIDIRHLSDRDAVQLARSLEIDIAVDLGGHTTNSRNNIFAMRAAPVQISYLGFSGTLGADYMDYLLADSVVIPAASRQFYTEKIVCLPDSYMPCDSGRPISERVFRREDFDLPASGFVFCCFNNTSKITPAAFDGWMRILAGVPGSVLWLSVENPDTAANLTREARSRGLADGRLIFARRLPSMAEHLARLRLADLFLDTLPYNAHTTSSDALWAGLPVLTRMGESFAGRVAASLLSALDLPELITRSAAEYEALAIGLANQPRKLATIRARLAENRLSKPLFNTGLYTQNLEAAYSRIHERQLAGLPAEHISP